VEVIEVTLAVEKGIAPACENSRAHEVIIERGEIKSHGGSTRFEADQASSRAIER
jgi:hypothetical protein